MLDRLPPADPLAEPSSTIVYCAVVAVMGMGACQRDCFLFFCTNRRNLLPQQQPILERVTTSAVILGPVGAC